MFNSSGKTSFVLLMICALLMAIAAVSRTASAQSMSTSSLFSINNIDSVINFMDSPLWWDSPDADFSFINGIVADPTKTPCCNIVDFLGATYDLVNQRTTFCYSISVQNLVTFGNTCIQRCPAVKFFELRLCDRIVLLTDPCNKTCIVPNGGNQNQKMLELKQIIQPGTSQRLCFQLAGLIPVVNNVPYVIGDAGKSFFWDDILRKSKQEYGLTHGPACTGFCPTAAQCPSGQVSFGPDGCGCTPVCQAVSVSCPPNFAFDRAECCCKCQTPFCPNPLQVLNRTTCTCECPFNVTTAAKLRLCTPPLTFNPSVCACVPPCVNGTRNTQQICICPSGFTLDVVSGLCLPINTPPVIRPCTCCNNGTCDITHGTCSCPSGFSLSTASCNCVPTGGGGGNTSAAGGSSVTTIIFTAILASVFLQLMHWLAAR